EDGDVLAEDGRVGGEVLGVLEIAAGGVDADGDLATGGEGVDELGGESGEVAVPSGRVGEGAGAEEDARGGESGGAARNVGGADALRASDAGLDDLALAEVVVQWALADAGGAGAIVIRAVGGGAEVGGGAGGAEGDGVAAGEVAKDLAGK